MNIDVKADILTQADGSVRVEFNTGGVPRCRIRTGSPGLTTGAWVDERGYF